MVNIMEFSSDMIGESMRRGEVAIGVFGMGWMGLPTACLLAEAGARVIGVDINPQVVDMINAGRSPVDEPGLQPLIQKHVLEGRLRATDDVGDAASRSDVILIVVPTLIDAQRRPDYSAVERVCRGIGLRLRMGCLVIFESTVGPGIMEGLVRAELETASGLGAGADFGLAYSPIRATAGRVLRDLTAYPRIVAGLDMRSLEAASAVLGVVVKGGLVKVRDIRTAEATKLFENVYRDVNIAMASELALFCERAGIRFEEVKEAANTQPYCHLHTPGIGVGGHCIPVNPYFLIDVAEDLKVDLRLVKGARRINDGMPDHTFRLVVEGLRACGKTLRRSRVAVLGVSYRANVKEARSSPARQVIGRLLKKGAKVNVFDPHFRAKEVEAMGYPASESLERAVENADCILAAVSHDALTGIRLEELARLVRRPACLVDACHLFNAEDAAEAGFVYREVGSGV